MYKSGKRYKKDRNTGKKLKRLLIFIICLAIIAFIIWLLIRPKTQSTNPEARVSQTKIDEVPVQRVVKDYFEIDLPADWRENTTKSTQNKKIIWEGKARNSIGRTLEIYVDTIPSNISLNRLIAVSGDGDQLAVGELSGQCNDFNKFNGGTLKSPPSDAVPVGAEWQGIEFSCDSPHYYRNVMGTGSKEGLNQFSLTGQTKGTHKYFFVYTDHASKQDDKVFPDLLKSLKAR